MGMETDLPVTPSWEVPEAMTSSLIDLEEIEAKGVRRAETLRTGLDNLSEHTIDESPGASRVGVAVFTAC